jgi:hypothetical protein
MIAYNHRLTYKNINFQSLFEVLVISCCLKSVLLTIYHYTTCDQPNSNQFDGLNDGLVGRILSLVPASLIGCSDLTQSW